MIGAAVLATVAASSTASTQGGSLGTIGLVFAAAALTLLAGVNLWARDSDVSAMDETRSDAVTGGGDAAGPVAVAAHRRRRRGAGRRRDRHLPSRLHLRLIALLAATAEWMVQAWSERASADAGFNASVRTRIAHPLEFPVLAAIGFAIIVYSFSRIMLFLSKTGGAVAFALIAALVLAAGFVIAFRPSLRTGAIAAVAVDRRPRADHRRSGRRLRGRAGPPPARDGRRPRRCSASAT